MEISRKKKIVSVGLLMLLVMYVIFYQMYLTKHFLIYADSITAALLIVVLAVAVLFLGYKKDKNNYLKKEVLKTVFIIIILFFAVTYAIGLKIGFSENVFSSTPYNILVNLFAPMVIVIASEFLRYVVITGTKDEENRVSTIALIIMVSLVLALVDISTQVTIDKFTSNLRAFALITTVIIPAISKSFMLSYLTCHVGMKTSLVYRMIMDLYFYIVPVMPDLSDYINSMIGVALPYLVYLYSAKLVSEYNGNVKEKIARPKMINFSEVVVIGIAVVFIGLISSKFSYYVLAIASESMTPELKVGDAVLVHKVKNDDDLDVGDIVIYENDGIKIVHRISAKEKNGKGIYNYRTKGDANGDDDNIDLTIDDIEGKVIVEVPYIGSPAVWISRLLD